MLLQLNKYFHPLVSHKPPSYLGVCFFFALLQGCSVIKIPYLKTKESYIGSQPIVEISKKDYVDHYSRLGEDFERNPDVIIYQLDSSSTKYLDQIIQEILSKNEVFFKNFKVASPIIFKNDSPLHLSLPGGQIYLSSALIKKYLKNESILASILAYELVKIHHALYTKEVVFPVGFLSLDKLISLNKLKLNQRLEIHKWSYSLTCRAGFDCTNYLSWLQIQNRNTADFILQVGDANVISREESLFKSFLIKNTQMTGAFQRRDSSKMFYSFINEIRKRE